MLFDLVSADVMRDAATGWWPAECSIKAGYKVCYLRLPCFTRNRTKLVDDTIFYNVDQLCIAYTAEATTA